VLGVNKTAAEVQELMESVDNDGSGKPTSTQQYWHTSAKGGGSAL